MNFITVSANREQLTILSQFLTTMFPGCTVYQGCNPMHAFRRLSIKNINAVFADVETCSQMVDLLNRQNIKTLIYPLCRQDTALSEELLDFGAPLSYPITEHKMQPVIQKLGRSYRAAAMD